MKLLELTLQNFLSFGPEEETIDFSEVGLYLICGVNGSGKSAILDALTFAVYGQPVRDINLPKIINEQVGENCKVGLKFELGGAIFWIERYRKHEKFKDALRIYKGTHDDEGLISKSDVKDAQEQVDDLIKMNYKAFINTIMLTQEDIAGFIEATPAKKKEIIESILQLDSFSKYHKIAQDKRKQKKKILDGLSVEVKTNEKLIENIKKSMEDYVDSCRQQKIKDKKVVADLSSKLSELKEVDVVFEFEQIKIAEELKNKQKQLLLDSKTVSDKKQSFTKERDLILASSQKERNAIVTSLQKECDNIALSFEKERDGLASSLKEYSSLLNENQKRIDKTKKEISALILRRTELMQKISDAENNPESCPFCGGEVDADLHHKYIAENKQLGDEMKKSIADLSQTLDSDKENIEKWNNKIVELKEKIGIIESEKNAKIAALDAENSIKIAALDAENSGVINNLELSIKAESKRLAELKAEYDAIEIPSVKDANEIQEISDKIRDIESQIKAFEDKEYIDKNYIASSKSKLVEVMTDLTRVNGEHAKHSKDFIFLQFWEDSLSSKKNSIKSWCINNIVGYFNARIKHFIDRFFEGRISIQFDNELNEVVKFKTFNRDFKQFSGGQRRRLNIAILFALHSLVKANVSNKIDIMFLDEVLSNYLDDKGISTVLNLLEEMKDNNESVWVIDHRDNFKNFPAFKRVDVFMDKKEFSHVKAG
jgi:DNA repair exonuclease SbcCD ATPase subunit